MSLWVFNTNERRRCQVDVREVKTSLCPGTRSNHCEKAVEELLTRQRVGIGFAITELSMHDRQEGCSFSSRLSCADTKSNRKFTTKESEEYRWLQQRYCRLMATIVAVFIFSSSASLWAQGFPRGHRDAWGPRYKAAPRGEPDTAPRTCRLRLCPSLERDRSRRQCARPRARGA